MVAEQRTAIIAALASGTTLTFNIPAPGPNSYVQLAVGFSPVGTSVVSVSCGSGIFAQVAAINSATKRLELWAGYGFGTGTSSSITVVKSSSSATMTIIARIIDVAGSAAALSSAAASTGNTATSTAANSGSVTPAVGDILLAAQVNLNNAAGSTVRTPTGNLYRENTSTGLAAVARIESTWGEATAAVPTSMVWTITSVEWCAIQAKWSPGATQTPSAAALVKGMATATADAASPY